MGRRRRFLRALALQEVSESKQFYLKEILEINRGRNRREARVKGIRHVDSVKYQIPTDSFTKPYELNIQEFCHQ